MICLSLIFHLELIKKSERIFISCFKKYMNALKKNTFSFDNKFMSWLNHIYQCNAENERINHLKYLTKINSAKIFILIDLTNFILFDKLGGNQ